MGNTESTQEFGPFGNLTSETGNANGNRMRYTGRELDEETGLYYYRARYYDPEVGRFLSEDSLGFDEGVNFYAYVKNNPINSMDPSGEAELQPLHRMIDNGEISIEPLIESGKIPNKEGDVETRPAQSLRKRSNPNDGRPKIFPKPKGPPAEVNKQGQEVLEGILNDKNAVSRINGGKLEIFSPVDGRGARFRDGKFDTFITPPDDGSLQRAIDNFPSLRRLFLVLTPIFVVADFAEGGAEGVIDGFIGGQPLDEEEFFPSNQNSNNNSPGGK